MSSIKGKKKKTKKVKKVKKSSQSKGYKRGSLMKAVNDLLERKGVDNVTYDECLKLAKSIKPNTKFNKYHFSWYKNNFRNRD